MLNLYINQTFTDELRSLIYSGSMFLHTNLSTNAAFCGYAKRCLYEVFGDDPQHVALPVEEFVELVAKLKQEFTNSQESKQHIRDFVEEVGQDPSDYFFDVPRIRVVPHYDYLHAGVSYAYLPHRDTWYGAPECQINTWMPVFPISPEQTMMINPYYFDQPVSNDSGEWDMKHWVQHERKQATKNIQREGRRHPVPLEDIRSDTELRLAGSSGNMIMFSGTHLHGTVPNRSGSIRYSIDFRIFHTEDLRQRKGAVNPDSSAGNVEFGLRDLLRVSDFTPYLEVVK